MNNAKELLQQKGHVIWFTGLSGSGKSTLATALQKELQDQGFLTRVLDGDVIRKGLNKDLRFTDADRTENIRRVAEVAKLFCDYGIITITAFISPTKAIRAMAQDIIGRENFFEIYLSTPLEVCEQRDPKGMYKKARAGLIPDFTGITAPYEAPEDAGLVIDTSKYTIGEATMRILDKIFPLMKK